MMIHRNRKTPVLLSEGDGGNRSHRWHHAFSGSSADNQSESADDQNYEVSPGSRKRGLIVTAGMILVLALIIIRVLLPMLDFVSDVDTFRQYIRSRGALGIARYVFMVVLQVITGVVPAGPFQVAAGSAFGIVPGAIICDLAMGLGSSLAFFLSRRFGMDYISMFVKREKLEKLSFLSTSPKKARLSFLIFLIPGMPKDLLTYILGMSDMKFRTFILIALVGRFPTIFLTVISGDALARRQGTLFIIMTAVSAIAYVVGFLYYGRRFIEKKHQDNE